MIKKIIDNIIGKKIGGTNIKLPPSIVDALNLRFSDFNIVFDIGAYHGSFTSEILIKNSNANVHIFEPYEKSYNIIKENFRNKKVEFNNVAISNTVGIEELFVNFFDETNSLLSSNSIDESIDKLTKTISSQKINVTTLDNYCVQKNIDNIDFMKIDTQGNSYNVLLGAKQLLKSKRVKYLYVETEFIQIYKDQKCFSEIELLMKNFGYQLVDFYNLNYNKGRLAWCDSLFTIE